VVKDSFGGIDENLLNSIYSNMRGFSTKKQLKSLETMVAKRLIDPKTFMAAHSRLNLTITMEVQETYKHYAEIEEQSQYFPDGIKEVFEQREGTHKMTEVFYLKNTLTIGLQQPKIKTANINPATYEKGSATTRLPFLEGMKAAVETFIEANKDTRPMFKDIARYFYLSNKFDRFSSYLPNTFPGNYAPYKKGTPNLREQLDNPYLVNSGKLRDSLTISRGSRRYYRPNSSENITRIGKTNITLGSRVPSAGFNQTGTVNMASRPPISLENEYRVEAIGVIVNRHIAGRSPWPTLKRRRFVRGGMGK